MFVPRPTTPTTRCTRSRPPAAPDAVGCPPDLPRAQARGVFARVVHTDAYDFDEEHRRFAEILIGNGLPGEPHHEVLDALKAGFEVVEEIDLIRTTDALVQAIDPYRVLVPWRDFWASRPRWGARHHHYGLGARTVAVTPGGMGVSGFLKRAPTASSGRQGDIYTVMYYTKAVKPK